MAREHKDFEAILSSLHVKLTSDDTLYEFPTLYKVDSRGKTRIFRMFVRIVKTPKIKDKLNDWDIMGDTPVKIKPRYLEGADLPVETCVQRWTEDGVQTGKITVHPPTYHLPKSVRNALQTALIAGQDAQLKKIKAGMVEDLSAKVTSKIYFPMLAENYHDFADNIVFPCHIQPKLDGHRFVSYLEFESKEVKMFTRNGHYDVGKDYLKLQLMPILEKYYDVDSKMSLYIDGEVYKHGMRLQDISSEARNTGKHRETSDLLDYNIFDVYYPGKDLKYADRLKIIKEIFADAKKHKIETTLKKCLKRFEKLDMSRSHSESEIKEIRETIMESKDDLRTGVTYKCLGNICMVPTVEILGYADIEWMFNLYLCLGYEGAIIRLNTPYKTSLNNPKGMRSRGLLKYKPRETDEFEICGFTSGTKGRAQNQIIWLCKTKNEHVFKVTPNIPDAERVKLFEECTKTECKDYIGKMYEVAYSKLSNDGVPLDAKGINFRPYK